MKLLKLIVVASVLVGSSFIFSNAQKAKPKPAAKPKPGIFAVTYDGTTIEPIALISNGKLIHSPSDADTFISKPFSDLYFKSGNRYDLVFGGVNSGTVNIVKSNTGSGECGGISAAVSVTSTRKLKGFVMALATNADIKAKAPGVRRAPTVDERNQAEKLVRTELGRQNISAASLKHLRSHNLTAIDVDGDGKAELVGSYWVAPKPTERSLLFFVASRKTDNSYSFEFSDFNKFTPDEIMSGDPKDLDDGVYHELLLDYFDYDGDGIAEIFTTSQAFEGRNFSVYRRESGKWVKVHESYNYRCGY